MNRSKSLRLGRSDYYEFGDISKGLWRKAKQKAKKVQEQAQEKMRGKTRRRTRRRTRRKSQLSYIFCHFYSSMSYYGCVVSNYRSQTFRMFKRQNLYAGLKRPMYKKHCLKALMRARLKTRVFGLQNVLMSG